METIEAHPAHQGEDSVRQDRAGDLEHLVRLAGVGARSGELGLPLLLHQGRARPGDRQRRKAGALRVHSRAGAAPGGEPAVQYAAGRGTGGVAHGARRLASASAEQKAGINQFHIAAITEYSRRAGKKVKAKAEDLPLDQRLANYIIEGTKDGLIADLDLKRQEARAARHHQRSADGRDVRSRPAVQQQRADRGRSAAIGRSHEGRGQPSRAVHGEDRDVGARQDHARHGQGRRPRHRQEPGRDHSRQQRL